MSQTGGGPAATRDEDSPRQGALARPGPARAAARTAAVIAAALVAVSRGDAVVVGVLLGVAALDLVSGAATVLAGLAVLGRWGSSSVAALAGGQAVLGAAGWTGRPALVLSSWAAAGALLAACPEEWVQVVAFGLAASAMVAGPVVAGAPAATVALRLAASVVGIAAAAGLARVLPRRTARPLALLSAAAAVGLALTAGV